MPRIFKEESMLKLIDTVSELTGIPKDEMLQCYQSKKNFELSERAKK